MHPALLFIFMLCGQQMTQTARTHCAVNWIASIDKIEPQNDYGLNHCYLLPRARMQAEERQRY